LNIPGTLKLYIAGWFGAKDRLKDVRDTIHELGVGKVVGTWLDEEVAAPADPTVAIGYGSLLTPREARVYALRDMVEVASADVLILDTIDVNPRGGREVEFGLALADGIAVWVVGPQRNVFHYLSHRVFPTWSEAIVALARRADRKVIV
jgi:hypothetical protein